MLKLGTAYLALWVSTLSCLGEPVAIEIPSAGGDPTTALCVVHHLPDSFLRQFRDTGSKAKGWRDWFSVHVVQQEGPLVTAMVGAYRIRGDSVEFRPRFGFRRGVRYVVRVSLPGEKEMQSTRFYFLRPETPQAHVVQVYPSANVLYENHLRFYIQFSQSMSRGAVYEHIELLNEKRERVADPFLTLDEELWDPEQKRLTLLFDPGRVKRELLPRQELGPAIIAGRTYTLLIKNTLKDATGRPIKSYRKRYKVLPPDVIQPNPKKWSIVAPTAPVHPLRIQFPKTLDWAMLHRVVEVFDAKEVHVVGTVTVGRHEKSWQFKPAAEWATGKYHIVIDTRLEDPVGNSIGRPFEVDLLRPVERTVPMSRVVLSFTVR
jgi:hypothetical protein